MREHDGLLAPASAHHVGPDVDREPFDAVERIVAVAGKEGEVNTTARHGLQRVHDLAGEGIVLGLRPADPPVEDVAEEDEGSPVLCDLRQEGHEAPGDVGLLLGQVHVADDRHREARRRNVEDGGDRDVRHAGSPSGRKGSRVRRRSEFDTTETLERAMATAASIGWRNPRAARGMPTVL